MLKKEQISHLTLVTENQQPKMLAQNALSLKGAESRSDESLLQRFKTIYKTKTKETRSCCYSFLKLFHLNEPKLYKTYAENTIKWSEVLIHASKQSLFGRTRKILERDMKINIDQALQEMKHQNSC